MGCIRLACRMVPAQAPLRRVLWWVHSRSKKRFTIKSWCINFITPTIKVQFSSFQTFIPLSVDLDEKSKWGALRKGKVCHTTQNGVFRCRRAFFLATHLRCEFSFQNPSSMRVPISWCCPANGVSNWDTWRLLQTVIAAWLTFIKCFE